MSNYCFFSPEALILADQAQITDKITQFSKLHKKQTYVLCKPLSKEDSTYEYNETLIIFAAGTLPCFVNIGNDDDGFDEYCDDFIDDISFLSEKFKYREKIGRKKHWATLFHQQPAEQLTFDTLVPKKSSDKRLVDLITSLVIGSINDVEKINLEPTTILETVKSKIVLFDTDQTSFVFKTERGKKFVIQGLAGSGKTELLLHKMKEIYSSDHEAKIAFTCFNKILASSMRNRIPDFFDFMRVERQIDWDNKLFCFHAWGSTSKHASGMYRYICHYYGTLFGTFNAGSFDYLCKQAIHEIKKLKGEHKFAFDYVFIDESQDFAQSFIDLCELVTEKKVFVAGDVFQNIFRPIDASVNVADILLKKCYRTDPKNLMFSHALGMGLFEDPVLRWLKPGEWDACGYHYKQLAERVSIKRDPLRRFEDIPDDYACTTIQQVIQPEKISDSIMNVIHEIKARHDDIMQGDIAVLFLDKTSYIYDVIPELKEKISEQLGWDVNISFETKTSDSDKLFISNINNAKGLEFPFVICFAMDLKRRPSFRNALYTMMARSFLESHLVVGSPRNPQIIESMSNGLEFLKNNGYMDLRLPTKEELENQEDLILLDEKPTVEEYVNKYCDGKNPTPRLHAKLVSRLTTIIGDDEYDEADIHSMLEIEYKRNVKL